jgi:hypothetical protein
MTHDAHPGLRERITEALRFWERGRVLYNLVLLAVCCAAVVKMGLPLSLFFSRAIVLWLIVGLIANLLFCAAYPIDLLVQSSDFRNFWLSVGRKVLLAAGIATAAVFAYPTALVLAVDSVK